MTQAADQLERELYDERAMPPANRPRYGAEAGVLERYGQRAIDVLKNYYETRVQPRVREWAVNTLGAEPYEPPVTVVIGETPTQYGLRVRTAKTGRMTVPIVTVEPRGKVFGFYDPKEHTLTVHYGVFPEFAKDDPDKAMLEANGIAYQTPEEVLVHERVHGLQREVGALDKYDRTLVEGLATKATQYILRKPQLVYQGAQKYAAKLIEQFGLRDAFKGAVPPAARAVPAPAYARA